MDIFSRWRKWLTFTTRAGVCRKAKRKYNKRQRQEARAEIARAEMGG